MKRRYSLKRRKRGLKGSIYNRDKDGGIILFFLIFKLIKKKLHVIPAKNAKPEKTW